MRKIDLAQERQRLTKLYAGMNDGELEKIASDPNSLTEWAKNLLREEINKRGLVWLEPPDPKLSFEIPSDDNVLVLLRTYENTAQAAQHKLALAVAGITSFFFMDDQAAAQGLVTWTATGGVKLLVRAADLAVSLELLADKLDASRNDYSADVSTDSHAQDTGKPIIIRSYRDLTEAMVDRTTLESAGIKCYLYDDNLIRLDWFVSNAIGGAKLVVSQNDAPEALKILSDRPPSLSPH